MLTFLEHARAVDLDDARVILVFLVETHLHQLCNWVLRG